MQNKRLYSKDMLYIYSITKPKKQTIMNDLMTTLTAKLQAKTITAKEKALLFRMAFGNEFMESNDKGAKKKYNV